MKVCRICLSKDGRLYPITSNGLRSLYHQLIGVVKLESDGDKGMPQWVCAECGLRLMSYNKLRQKSLRSHQILTDLLERLTYITEEDINKIDREKNNLQSNLSYTVIDHGIIQQYEEVNIQETDESDCRTSLKIKEFDFKEVEISSLFKTENDSDDCHSEAAVSETVNNSDREIEVNSDNDANICSDDDANQSSDSSSSVNKFLKSFSSCTLKKVDKKVQSDVLEQVDQLINSLDKKTTKTIENEVKKEVRRVKKEVKSVKNEVKRVNKNVKVEKSSDAYPIEDIFTVQTLSFEEQMAEFQRRKYSTNYADAPFKCNDCLIGFNSEETLARHKMAHSEERGKLECNICKKRFRLTYPYCRHMKAHATIYHCKECPFITRIRSKAIMHRSKHKGKVYNCAHCDLEFVNQSSYLSHLRIKHVSQFVCEYCGYSFVSAKGLDQHKNFKHKQEMTSQIVSTDGPTCATCQIRFVTDKALDTHLRVAHLQNSDRRKRNTHEGYENKMSIICELCGVKTSDGTSYRIHFRRHHPNKSPTKYPTRPKPSQQFMCDQCGRVFKNKSYLQQHALVHSGERPYECHDCNKRFISKAAVQSHILNMHLPKKLYYQPKKYMNLSKKRLKAETSRANTERYPCNICGMEFTRKANMQRHIIVVHTGLRPFICDICGSTFKTKAEVNLHTTHVHLKKPWPKRKSGGVARSSRNVQEQYYDK